MNFVTSSGVGGRPIRSKLKRRMSVRRSASGESRNLSCSSLARMNRSIGLRARFESLGDGIAGCFADLKLHQSDLSGVFVWPADLACPKRTQANAVIRMVLPSFMHKSKWSFGLGVIMGDERWRENPKRVR